MLVVLACVALASSLTACAASNDYPDSVRANFIGACETQPGATTSLCERCLDVVEDSFSYDEFVELDTAIRAGTATRADSDKLAGIISSCA